MKYDINSFKDRTDIASNESLSKSRQIINAQMKYVYDFLEPVESIIFKKIYDKRSDEDQVNYWLDIHHINEINAVTGIFERIYSTVSSIRGGQLYIYGTGNNESGGLPLVYSAGKDGIYLGSMKLGKDCGEEGEENLMITFDADLMSRPNFHKSGLYIIDEPNSVIDLVLDNDQSVICHDEVVTFALSDNVPTATIKLKLTLSSYSEENPNDVIELTDLRPSVTLYRTDSDRYTVLTPFASGSGGGGGDITEILKNYVTKYVFNTTVEEIYNEIEKIKEKPVAYESNNIEGQIAQIKPYEGDDGTIMNEIVLNEDCDDVLIVLKDNVEYVDNGDIYYLYIDKTTLPEKSRILITNVTGKAFYTLDNALYIPNQTTTELYYYKGYLTPVCSDYIDGRPYTDPNYVEKVTTYPTYDDGVSYSSRLNGLEEDLSNIIEQVENVLDNDDIDSLWSEA